MNWTGPDVGNATAEEFWQRLYAGRVDTAQPAPNPAFLDQVRDLPPGRALDLGCGLGGDALWLAERGWWVTAVDVSPAALARSHELALHYGVDHRMRFLSHDLEAGPPPGSFELVYACYLHSPVTWDRDGLLRAAIAQVSTDGTYLQIDHGSVAPWSWGDPEAGFPSPEDLLARLALSAGWRVIVAENLHRTAQGPGGQSAVVTDTILRLEHPATVDGPTTPVK